MKYADDTYLVIPAYNVDSRDNEIANIDAWAKVNNLTLNASKSVEIVFQDSRKRHRAGVSRQPGPQCKALGGTLPLHAL